MINFAELKEHEARRRLKLLGTTIEDASGAGLRARARSIGLPLAILRQWHASYLHGGFEALIPAWKPVSEATFYLMEQRYAQLGVCEEAETLIREDQEALAHAPGLSLHLPEVRARRWWSSPTCLTRRPTSLRSSLSL